MRSHTLNSCCQFSSFLLHPSRDLFNHVPSKCVKTSNKYSPSWEGVLQQANIGNKHGVAQGWIYIYIYIVPNVLPPSSPKLSLCSQHFSQSSQGAPQHFFNSSSLCPIHFGQICPLQPIQVGGTLLYILYLLYMFFQGVHSFCTTLM